MEKFKFVIADDAIFMRTVLKKIISDINNYEVVDEAATGYEAIDKAKKYQPDVMTLDITMPGMDGIKAIKGILEVSPNTKIIMVSAMGQKGMVVDAIKSGARDFIVKPFDQYKVLESIKNVLSL